MRSTGFSLCLLALCVSACGTNRLISADDEETQTNATDSDSAPSTDSQSTADTTSETTDPQTGETDPSSAATNFVPDIPDPNDGSCDPWAQDCPEGEKCVPTTGNGGTWDTTQCVPVLGDQAPGEPCISDGYDVATDDCDASGTCWYLDPIEGEDTYSGTCLAQCTGTPDAPMCPEASQCSLSGDGSLILCIPSCNPLLQDCAQMDHGCYWSGADFVCAPNAEPIPAGGACGYINDCAPSLICIDALNLPACEGPSCCTSFCELGMGDAPCEAAFPGTSCVPFWEEQEAPAGYEDVGLCIVF